MSSVLKWFGFDIPKILERRHVQLEQQKSNDKELRDLSCQTIVAQYLLEQREQNRQLCKEYENLSYTEYYALTLKHLDIVDKETERLKTVLQRCENPCYSLIETKKNI